MTEEQAYFEDNDPGATMHGRRVVSESPLQRQADATMARLRGERARARRERLRDIRVSGRRTWKDVNSED